MAQVVAMDTKLVKDILTALRELKEEMARLREKFEGPPYGSNAWWEWTEKRADEDIKAGRYKVYSNAKDLINDLHKGK